VHVAGDVHAPQLSPTGPHVAFVSDAYPTHVPVVPPLQQPLRQVLASHVHVPFVLSQRLFAHVVHDAPPLPHCEGVSDA
jgi:hypothetical protein